MTEFEKSLNSVLVDVFNSILKYEETSLKTISAIPVTISEVHMIEAIAKNGDNVNISDIAASLNISLPTVTAAVKKLVEKGLVNKMPCSFDGRRFIVSLTETGQKINKAHSLFHRKMVRNISSNFSDQEQEVLLKAVKKLSEFFMAKAGL